MKENNAPQQVSLAGAAAGNNHAVRSSRKSVRRWILLGAVAALVLIVVISVIVKNGQKGPSLTAREMIRYRFTPDAVSDDVTYVALGILGENADSRMDMVSLMCFDRKHKSASVLQLPVSTYVGDTGTFAVNTVGDVWARPKALTWCPTCRRAVGTEETDAGKHAACGTQLETRAGSSATNFAELFNKQYGLPVDNYLVAPREGLARLIDAVGGVDMKVEQKLTVGEETYEPGIRTLSGAAAVYYATQYGYDGTPTSDRARMMRQRQLFAGLLSRLSGYKVNELFNTEPSKADILSNVMLGSSPIRMDAGSFGKARLMNASESRAEDTKFVQALAEFVRDFTRIPLDKITCRMLPGVEVKIGTATVYSPAVDRVKAIISSEMDPYSVSEAPAVTSLQSNLPSADEAVGTLSQVLVQAETATQ